MELVKSEVLGEPRLLRPVPARPHLLDPAERRRAGRDARVGDADLRCSPTRPSWRLIRKLAEIPELIEESARLRAPHRLTHYAQALASLFSAFYRDCRVLSDDVELTGSSPGAGRRHPPGASPTRSIAAGRRRTGEHVSAFDDLRAALPDCAAVNEQGHLEHRRGATPSSWPRSYGTPLFVF